jgi:arylsulfatase
MPSTRTATLLMDGVEAGSLDTRMLGFNSQVSFSGLDIGLDRGSPVSHYAAPFALRGARLFRVEYQLDPLQRLDLEQLALVEMARQ